VLAAGACSSEAEKRVLAADAAAGGTAGAGGGAHSSGGGGGGAGNASGNAADAASGGAGGASDAPCQEADEPPFEVVDEKGALIAADYRRIASRFGQSEGMRYRFGETASCYHSSLPSVPAIHQPSDKICLRPGNYGSGFLYQVGEDPCAQDVGDYSSTQGIALYTADEPTDGGVNILQVIAEGFNTFQSKPQPSWTLGSPIPSQLGLEAWVEANGGPVNTPIAAARSYRDPNGEMNVNALVVFQSGLIGAIGENTASGGFHMKLPAGVVPTAIALTNGNEFALVTVWDTEALEGKIAIYAMTSCEESAEPMCAPGSSLLSGYAIQHQPYPGFANAGSFTGAKFLGFVSLPGLRAPTAISATSNYRTGWWTRQGANTDVAKMDFTREEDRQTFVVGENRAKYSQAGFAVVLSLSEKKAAFVDLKPLFAFYEKMYFSDLPSFQATRAMGSAPHQWPYTFGDAPEQIPVVVSTLDLTDRPTAAATARYKAAATEDGYGALIATRRGLLKSYAVGGLVDGTGATAGDIREVGSVPVGANPTGLTYRKAHVWNGNDPFSGSAESVTRNEVIVVSRGDREIQFVKLEGKGERGSVYQRLKDATMIDPIAAEDNDTHGTESYVLTVADHAGKRIINYRFGPVILHTNGGASYGMGREGTDDFELGGTFAVTGKPFLFSSANVP
jgi:hypothetical protein